ncbi:hypothetical protein NQ025_12220, partial [Corynebacterium phoceense]|nr:hypothetical protein [Corynebacterium phoceense]
MLWEWSTENGKEEATDIDPFTVYALINRLLTMSNKEAIYRGLKEAFDISAEVPTSVDGLPVRNNLSARFESKYTDPGNTAFYDGIWTLFEAALRYNPREKHGHSRVDFIEAYDAAVKDRSQVAYTMGLFWIRPETFMALDRRNADLTPVWWTPDIQPGWVGKKGNLPPCLGTPNSSNVMLWPSMKT